MKAWCSTGSSDNDNRFGPGKPYPLGATWDGRGTNFAVFSEHASTVHLCLFDDDGAEAARVELSERTDHVWHAYARSVGPGQRYGFRVDGPYRPENGHRFNPHKLLLDPYAKALAGTLDWSGPVRGYDPRAASGDLSFDDGDSALLVPKSVVVDTAFDWEGDRRPEVPWHDTVIYETHVRGLTQRHQAVPPSLRGTYLGLCQPPVIAHLKSIGVTAVELLPIHAFVDEEFLIQRGLRDYWGYNTIGFFAPEGRYAASRTCAEQVREFKTMVKTLHAHGLEVILDVVYNHTAEGDHLGPTLSFRGLDNASYYRLFPGQSRFYHDVTGTGNTLNTRHPQVLQLIMDSLRYWVDEMHVDGFRFDLTPALARDPHDVDTHGAFFRVIHQDPVLAGIKLIAEPWDLGDDGYHVGRFPIRWSEWNDQFRDSVRSFWRGDPGRAADIAYRLAGSSELFGGSGRPPRSSINYVTAHDGFTLEDLVSYQRKHNEANGEGNRDGADHNLSTNHGHEGPTDDASILAARDRHKRNLLATLFLAIGVPMINGGDEIGRTQRGNNNAYCQDNGVSWYSWEIRGRDEQILAFTQQMAGLRKELTALRRRTYFDGSAQRTGVRDLTWLRPDGNEMSESDWRAPHLTALGLQIAHDAQDGLSATDVERLVILLNAGSNAVEFALPEMTGDAQSGWQLLLNTSEWAMPVGRLVASNQRVRVSTSSLQLYRRAAMGEVAAADRDR